MSNATSAEAGPSMATNQVSPEKSTKRKFDEALHLLDEAMKPVDATNTPSQPVSTKRARIRRSIYSTLSRYGIKAKADENSKKDTNGDDPILKSAPHLAAILKRTASKTASAIPFRFSRSSEDQMLPLSSDPNCEYRPSSTASFLKRLSTYTLATYSNKPAAIDAVAATKCGWVNEGKDRLVCNICGVSWVVAGREGMNKDASNTLLEKQRTQLVEAHKDGCPWKVRQCDPEIYRVPLKPPAVMARELKSRAIELDPVMVGINVRHPLALTQLHTLMSAIKSSEIVSGTSISEGATLPEECTSDKASVAVEPSEPAILTALFGWSVAPPASSSRTSLSRPATPSLSRANTTVSISNSGVAVATGSSRTTSPAVSREGTPNPSPSVGSIKRISGPRRLSSLNPATSKEKDTRLLQCELCQRRIGLWAFSESASSGNSQAKAKAHSRTRSDSSSTPTPSPTSPQFTIKSTPLPQRHLDLLKEHRSYCPYVVRSSEVPSLPSYPSPPPKRPTSIHSILSSSSSAPAGISGSGENGNSAANGSGVGLIEGWRAVLAVVSRAALARRQRERLSRAVSARLSASSQKKTKSQAQAQPEEQPVVASLPVVGEEQAGEGMDVDRDQPVDEFDHVEFNGIDAMVEDVKAHGSRDLLRYVRSLLG